MTEIRNQKPETRKKIRLLVTAGFWLLASGFCAGTAHALPLIRDAEIEHTLRMYGDPIFRIGGLKPSNVHLFIVNDDSLNSFVAGGANMFIHTGIIMDCATPDMLIGVMAHETGHIVGGHLAQGSEKLKDAGTGSILTYVLGAAAAVASKKPEVAAAVISGGQNSMMRNFLAFTRAHEESADQFALRALDQMHISASGLVEVFELLRRHEREHAGSPDPYMLTHPLTSTRIEFVRAHADASKIPAGQYPKNYDMPHQRMIAKLYGFLESPERTLQHYPQSNTGVPARMARAIAFYKMPDMTRALQEMDSLLLEHPDDPFFHELKGQMLFENNHPKEALASYREAVKFLPDSPLILADLGKVEISQNDASLIPSAINHLEKSTALDDSNADAWHQLGIAYGKAGNKGLSSLALAEEALLGNDPLLALTQVSQALTALPRGTPAWQRAQDLKTRAQEVRKEQKEKE